MILTEHGLHFHRAPSGNTWRCIEEPAIQMLGGGGYRVAGVEVDALTAALKVAREGLPPVPPWPPLTRVYGPEGHHEGGCDQPEQARISRKGCPQDLPYSCRTDGHEKT